MIQGLATLMTTLLLTQGQLGAEPLDGPACENGPQLPLADTTEIIQGRALAGVDHLGRVSIAVDTDRDGDADRCFLYTGADRIAGPWGLILEDVTISYRNRGSLTLDSTNGLAFSLAITAVDVPDVERVEYSRLIQEADGAELVSIRAPAIGGAQLDSMSHYDVSTWPESFWYDYHDPESQKLCESDRDCRSGGRESNSCSIEGCGGTQEGACSVSCGAFPRDYACCKCLSIWRGGEPDCRCRPCDTMLP